MVRVETRSSQPIWIVLRGALNSIARLFSRSTPLQLARVMGLATVLVALTWELSSRWIDKSGHFNGYVHDLLDLSFLLLIGFAVYLAAATMAERKEQMKQRYRAATIDFIRRLTHLASWRDDETGEHAERVGQYCAVIAEGLGMSAEHAQEMVYAGMLHDIGKIAVPDRLLLTYDKFSDEDRSIMQSHTLLGSDIFVDSGEPILKKAELVALSHHEWWDGTGYPYGLTGQDIPLEGRIAALADVFDALTTKRRYKEAFDFAKSVEIVHSLSGTQLDPKVVSAFMDNLAKIKKVYIRFRNAPTAIGINRAS